MWAAHVARARWTPGEKKTPVYLPEVVRRITIEDFVSGKIHVFELRACSRIDQYCVLMDGIAWNEFAGLSVILAKIRKMWGRYRRMM